MNPINKVKMQKMHKMMQKSMIKIIQAANKMIIINKNDFIK